MAKQRSADYRMSVFTSDQDIADFAADMGFVSRRGDYYGIGAWDFDVDDLLDSFDLMSLLMSRWTVRNFLDMLEDVDEDKLTTPRIISMAILEEERKLRISMLMDTRGG